MVGVINEFLSNSITSEKNKQYHNNRIMSLCAYFSILLIINLHFSCYCCSSNSRPNNPDIILIGAGPAGIAAATKLLENSFSNIKIIEAEDRIGGRIKSVKFGDGFVDVGAEYCHGEENNIVYNLVKELNFLKPVSDKKFLTTLYFSNGSKIAESLTEELQQVILGYGDYASDGNFNKTGATYQELFLQKYNTTILKKYANDSEVLKILKSAIDLAEKVSLMIDGAFSWSETSASKHYQRSNGYQLLVWGGRGYKTILEFLMKKNPIDNKLILSTKVEKILWNDTKVSVRTNNSTYLADHVIFTGSVGVLKGQVGDLFVPTLPREKLEAIESIGMAGVMKIIMLFPNQWWGADDVIFTFLWDEGDLREASEKFADKGPVINGISWISAIGLLAKVPGNPRVLTAWITTEFVPEIEKTDEDILKQGCIYVINKFFGRDYNVSEPEKIIKSDWNTNSNFRGTYSYEKAGLDTTGISYQNILAEPLKNVEGKDVFFFAGEATNPIHYSTVHGAIESGHREAERIIKLYS